jgi:hypothetical protein
VVCAWVRAVYAAIHAPPGTSFGSEVHIIFFGIYDWPPFVIALGFSILGLPVGAAFELGLQAIPPTPDPHPRLSSAC